MKQILTITLMFFYFVSCSSSDEKESSAVEKKAQLNPTKKVLITPNEASIVKKLHKSGKFFYEKTANGEVIFLGTSQKKEFNYIRTTEKQIKEFQKGLEEKLEKRLELTELSPNELNALSFMWGAWLIKYDFICDGKYCNDILVDENNDGIIEYVVKPAKDYDYCRNYVNSDGVLDGILCSYRDEKNKFHKIAFDITGNGTPSKFEYNDTSKENCKKKIEYDENESGRIEKSDYYENCQLVRREIDENENGKIEEIIYYNKKGEYDHSWSIGGDNVKKANDALEAKKYDEAIKFYKAANQELYREWGSDTDKICFNLNNIGQAYYNKGDGVQTVEVMTALSKNKLCSWTGYDAFLYIGFAQKYLMKNNEAAKAGFENAVDFSKKKDPTAAIPIDALFQLIMIHYENKDYQKCIATVKQIPEKELSNVGKSSVFFFSGTCQLNLRNYDQAEKDFETSLKYAESNEQKSATYYNFACADALQNKRSSAINRLKKAISFSSNQGSVRKAAKTDSDFTNLANDPEFKKLVE